MKPLDYNQIQCFNIGNKTRLIICDVVSIELTPEESDVFCASAIRVVNTLFPAAQRLEQSLKRARKLQAKEATK